MPDTRSIAHRSAALIVILLAVTSLPYLYARLSAPADVVYTGLMYDVPDHAQYWSWVTASRRALFISNTMTPEANSPVFMNPMMWLLARVQGALGLSFPALFQWWRAGVVILFVPLLLAFVRALVPESDRRPVALWLALVGSGFGWIWVVAKKFSAAAEVAFPHDLYTLEPNTFWALLGYPYILLAHALLLATFLGAWLAHRGKGWPAFVLAGVASACLSFSHAYDLITVYAVLGLFGVIEWISTRQLPTRLAAVGVVIASLSGPAALYYQRLTTGDPLWRAILGQYVNAGVWTPPHWHLIILMGLPLLLAVLGLVPVGGWTAERRFLAVWAVTGLSLIYLPVVYQIKLLSGWQFPIAILATYGWHERAASRLRDRKIWRPATAALVAVASLTNLYLFAWRFVDLRRHSAPYFLHREVVDALDWLAAHARPSDLVLAPLEIGQFIPNYGASRTYVAHWAMTNRFYERRTNADRFFDPKTSEAWRVDLLEREHVTLVLRSDWPSSDAAPYDGRPSTRSEAMFLRPHVQIYRVRPTSDPASTVGSRNR